MPILITQDIINATKQPEAGWSLIELKDYKEKPSKKTQGFIDYFWVFECISGPGNSQTNASRGFTTIVFGNALASGVPESAKTVIDLTTSLLKCRADEIVGKEIDYTKLFGHKVWCEIKDEPYEGRLLKKSNCFAPDDVVPF
jgi:hypothetical protein